MDFELIPGRGADYGVAHIRIINAQTLALLVARAGEVSMERAVELVELGAAYVNEVRMLTVATELQSGDHVRVHFSPRRFECKRGLIERIVSTFPEMNLAKSMKDQLPLLSYVIVNKPAGLPTHAQVDNAKENLISLLETEVEQERGIKLKLLITHRLDIETSGVLILALNHEAQRKINQDLQSKLITRRYHAWVETPIAPGNYRHFMQPSRSAPKIVSTAPQTNWAECSLSILSCERSEEVLGACELAGPSPVLELIGSRSFWRLTIELQTGRSQQIRAQLAHLGSPILGDQAYGSTNSFTGSFASGAAIALRAFQVSRNRLGEN